MAPETKKKIIRMSKDREHETRNSEAERALGLSCQLLESKAGLKVGMAAWFVFDVAVFVFAVDEHPSGRFSELAGGRGCRVRRGNWRGWQKKGREGDGPGRIFTTGV